MPSIKLLCTVFTVLALSYLSYLSAFTLPTHQTRCCIIKNDIGIASHRHNLSKLKSKIDDNYNDNTNDDNEEENDGDDNIINLSESIKIDNNKLFDLDGEVGYIRSLQAPEYNPIEAVSAEEIELWLAKKDKVDKKQKQKKLYRKIFPWLPPLISILVPTKHAPSKTYDTQSSRISRISDVPKKHSNFNNGVGAPRLLRRFITTPNSARNLLLTLNIISFIYQIITAVYYLPGFNRVLAASVAGDAISAVALEQGGNHIIPQWTPTEVVLRALGLVGGGAGVVIASGSTMRGVRGRLVGRGPIAAHSQGPYFLDYAHQPYPLSHFQRHRYLSSGFLHGSLLHLFINMRALIQLPSWLENGIGKTVYLSAYLIAIVTGNIAHTLITVGSSRASSALCIGASGGICGLYGLMLSSLMKMGNADATYYVCKQMIWLLLYGFLIPNISNAGHLGGFIGGWLVGYLFGPGYERSYTLNRSGGLSRDSADWEFRQMMGPGIYPSKNRAIFPLKYLMYGIGALIVARPELRTVPIFLIQGIISPGSLSGTRTLLKI